MNAACWLHFFLFFSEFIPPCVLSLAQKSRRNLLVVQPPPRPDLSAKTIVDVLVQNVDETRCKEADLRLHYTYLVA